MMIQSMVCRCIPKPRGRVYAIPSRSRARFEVPRKHPLGWGIPRAEIPPSVAPLVWLRPANVSPLAFQLLASLWANSPAGRRQYG